MTLENWAEAGKLLKYTPDTKEIIAIFGVIERNMQDASLEGLSSDQRYILSYQSALEAARALIYSNGFKPIKTGHHYITWQCLKELLLDTWRKEIILFQDAAKKRSRLSYDLAGIASTKEANEMHAEAKGFVDFVKEAIEAKFKIKL